MKIKTLKQLKIYTLYIIFAFSIFSVTACSGNNDKTPESSQEPFVTASIDIDAFSETIKNNINFSSELKKLETSAVENFFDIEEDYDAVMYSSDSTCEQFAVFKMESEKDIPVMKENISALLSDQKDTFALYSAKDVERIDNAVIAESSVYIVFCVCDEPEKADKLINDIFSGKVGLKNQESNSDNTTDPNSSVNETTQPDPDSTSNHTLEPVSKSTPESVSKPTPEPVTEPPIEPVQPSDRPSEIDGNTKAPDSTDKPKATAQIIPTKEPDGESKDDPKQTKYETIIKSGKVKKYDKYYVIGDACYYFYSYAKKSSERYASALNLLADKLDGKTTVYSIPVMTASGIVFPDNYESIRVGISMDSGVKKINAVLSDKVKKINMYDTLMQHRTEYLFFRTDHHWTALGAYYAYTDFCKAKGIEAESLDSYKTETFDNFKGSYSFTTEDPDLIANPDYVTVYYPNAKDASLYFYDEKGNKKNWPIIANVRKSLPGGKYSTFAAGDKSLTVITNNDIKDNSKCIVVKDSYGNAFVPFLVDHYHKIYEIDFRYWNGDLVKFANDYKVDDILFVISILNTGSKYTTSKIYNMCDYKSTSVTAEG